MTKFDKPGVREDDYPDWIKEAGEKALKDAGIPYSKVEQACCGYVYGDTTAGQRGIYQLGMTGIPVYNVNNACSSGSTALMMARQFIEGGLNDCVLAIGFEKMEPGSLSAKFMDRTNPMDLHLTAMIEDRGLTESPVTAQMFGNAGREHMEKYGTTADHFAKIAYKNHKHSVNNPYAQFQKHYTLDEIKASRMIHDPLTKLQCSPTSDGSACAILASEDFVRKHGLESRAVEIIGQEMVTDLPSTFTKSASKIVGYDMSKTAADRLYKNTGINPADIDVIELHDCFSTNELLTYEALGLCKEGEGGKMVDRGDNTYGGKYVINPSGGLESKGHPLGATGLAQCAELTWQLRGQADKRQVAGAKLALQHNIGLGGAAVVTMYRLGFPSQTTQQTKSAAGADFMVAPIFEEIKNAMQKDGSTYVRKIKGTYSFKVRNASGKEVVWFVDCKTGNGSVEANTTKKADCTITMADKDLFDLMTGKLEGQKAFMQGKLKLTGNMGLAMKLKELQLTAPSSKM